MFRLRNIDKFIKNLDIAVAVLGCILGILLILVYIRASTILILIVGVSLLIVSPIYLLFHRIHTIKTLFDDSKNTQLYYSRNICHVTNILFWILITLSYIILIISDGVRPLLYFILVALAAGLISLSLFEHKDSPFKSSIEIIKVLVLGFNIRLSVYFFRSGNGGSGGDFFQHMAGNNILSQTGSLDLMGLATRTLNKEISFPLMHIQTAISDLITNLPIKLSTFIAISIPLLIATIFVYLVARELFNEKTAILSTLILSVCDYVILWGFGPTTTSFGLCIFYFSMYCMVKIWKNNSNILWVFLLIVLSVFIILTHAVSSYVMLVSLIAFSLGLSVYAKYFAHSKIKLSYWFFPVMYTIVMTIFWTYANYSTSTTFFDKISGMLIGTLNTQAALFQTVASSVSSGGFSEPAITLFLSYFGYIILFVFSIFGMYLLLHRKIIFKEGFCILSAYLLLQFVTYVFPIFGLRNIIPDRWFAFIWFFASILMAFAIVYLSNIYGKKIVWLIPIVIIVFAFSMVTGIIANDESPIVSKEFRNSNSYTFKEVAAGQMLDSYVIDGQLITDYYYRIQFQSENLDLEMNDLKYNDVLEINSGRTPEKLMNSLIVYRNEMKDRGIRIYWANPKTDRDAIIKVAFGENFLKQLQKYSQVYDIGTVSAYSV